MQKRRKWHLERDHSGVMALALCAPIRFHTPIEVRSDVLRTSWRCLVAECPCGLAAECTEGRRPLVVESENLRHRMDMHPDLSGEEFRRLAVMELKP